MSMSRCVVFLVMVRPKKLTLLLYSGLGLSWMQLWNELMYCSMF